VPFYVVGRALGFHSASEHRVHENLSLWWQTLWGAMVPFAALLVLMWDRARRQARAGALPAVLALGFGTLMLPHAANLYGHALAGLFAFGAWVVLDRGRGAARSLGTAGLLAGLAVSVEYHTAIIGVVVAVVAAIRWRGRAWWLALGAALPLAMTALYQQVAFGRPWHLAYTYLTTTSNDGHYGIPSPTQLADIVAGAHGLLLTSPVILLAVAAAIVVARDGRGAARTDARVALAVFVPYFLLVAGWTGTPLLEQPGPRYLIPALPFLAAPLAGMWARFRPVAVITALWGGAVMVAGSVTMHLVRPHDQPFHVYFSNVLDRRFNPTLWSIMFGPAGVFVYVGLIAVAGLGLLRAQRRLVGDAT
jgi:hypothetical protein